MNFQVKSHSYPIESGPLHLSSFEKLMRENYPDSKKLILLDENTHEHCLEYLLTRFSDLSDAEIIVIPAGEEHKTVEVCLQVWEALSEYRISRQDLLINLGGGLVSDMGGFIASVFKRGIDFINIPTSLLAMTDAAFGGKTGIDLGPYKNQLGLFSNPVALYIDVAFLKTLPQKELQNGFAEMLKHGLIEDKEHWNKLKKTKIEALDHELIFESLQIKMKLVSADPFEKNVRKKLNFGHTFGHAIEGYYINSREKIDHGHAVALGMLCESQLSFGRKLISQAEFQEISDFISGIYPIPDFSAADDEKWIELMLQDKKNTQGRINCVLLDGIGQSLIDQQLGIDEIKSAFEFLKNLKSAI